MLLCLIVFSPVESLEVGMKTHCWKLAGLYPLSMPYIFTSGSNILKIDLDVHGDCFKYRIGVFCVYAFGQDLGQAGYVISALVFN